MVSWSAEEERRVISLVHSCLTATEGSWRATVIHSAVLAHCWVVQIAHSAGNGSRSILLDTRAPRPAETLDQAIASLAAGLSGAVS